MASHQRKSVTGDELADHWLPRLWQANFDKARSRTQLTATERCRAQLPHQWTACLAQVTLPILMSMRLSSRRYIHMALGPADVDTLLNFPGTATPSCWPVAEPSGPAEVDSPPAHQRPGPGRWVGAGHPGGQRCSTGPEHQQEALLLPAGHRTCISLHCSAAGSLLSCLPLPPALSAATPPTWVLGALETVSGFITAGLPLLCGAEAARYFMIEAS